MSTVILQGGPFDGVEVPRPEYRWGRLNLTEGDGQRGDTVHVYRPLRSGSYVYDGPSEVLLTIPAGGAK